MTTRTMPTDRRIQRLERAHRRLKAAQKELDAALFDLLQNGPRGAQAAATRITGLNRDTLRRRRREHEKQQERDDTSGSPTAPALLAA